MIYNYKNYKLYLKKVFREKPAGIGNRSQLGKFLQCNSGFVSQVLNGHVNFSLEHAIKINHFLGHDSEQSHYFMLLVHLERAGTQELKEYYLRQIEEIQNEHKKIKKQIPQSKKIPEHEQNMYYRVWSISAIHMASMIPELNTVDAMARRLSLSPNFVRKTLEFLCSHGLVNELNNTYQIGQTRIHLDANSPFIFNHHTNWRLQALRAIEKMSPDDNFYSSIIAMGKEDYCKIKDVLMKSLQQIEKIIRPSPEEELYAFNFDLFKLP